MSTTLAADASSAVSKATGPKRQTFPALDGLRALAILLVVWCHTSEDSLSHGVDVGPTPIRTIADFGFSGVFLFFVLSGFLPFLPYARALVGTRPWPSARQFYLRRALRILPLYFVSLIAFFVSVDSPLWHSPHIASLPFVVLLLPDTRSDVFNLMSALDGPFWTLAVEWQFYLLLPWLALALAKLAGPRLSQCFFLRLFGALGALVVLGLCIRALAAGYHYTTGQAPVDAPGMLGLALKVLYGLLGPPTKFTTLRNTFP